MSRYRKRPVVIEAEQFTAWYRPPAGVTVDYCEDCPDCNAHSASIETLEGPLNVSLNDWIITGVKGERYPCKPDIFALTYEKADTPEAGRAPLRPEIREALERGIYALGGGHDIRPDLAQSTIATLRSFLAVSTEGQE